MEAEADLINYGKESSLEAELDNLALDEEIEKELQALKSAKTKQQEATLNDSTL